MRRPSTYFFQQAFLLATFPFATFFLLGTILLLSQVRDHELWIAAAAFCILSPFLAWFLASRAFPFSTTPASTSLLRYADRIAKFEARTGSVILGGITLGIAAFFAWIVSTNTPTLHSAFGAITMLAFAAAIASLLWREFSLLRYFAAGRNANINQQRLEVWYEAALAEQRRALRSTLQRVTIQNYCAARNGVCSKTLAYQGSKSSFAAYSFQPPVIKRMVDMRDALHKLGHTVLLPTDDNLAQVLVCKLCQTILSCQHLIAEATEPNANVYFEYGLALGHRKKSWLIAIGDLASDHPLRHRLLRDTISVQRKQFVHEEIAADIDRDALQLRSTAQPLADRIIPAQQLHTLPDRSSNGVVIVTPNNIDATQTTPGSITEFLALITTTITSEGLTLLDPFEPSAQHTAGQILEALESVRAVVAILAADTVPNHQSINAIICFLLGYALAKERPLLIFQMMPSQKELLDLAGLVRFVHSPIDFREAWLEMGPRLLNPRTATDVLPPIG